MSVFLSHIDYQLGSCVPITPDSLGGPQELVDGLRVDGQTSFRRADVAGSELAARAAGVTLESMRAAGVEPSEILYCTESRWEGRVSAVTLSFRRALGLDTTPTTVVAGFACANLVAGIRVGQALTAAGGVPAVMIATSDQFEDQDQDQDEGEVSRVLGDGLAVISDAAATCALTAQPHGPSFRVVALSLQSIASLAATSVAFTDLKASARVIGAAVSEALADARLTRADIGWVVVNNYRPASRRFLAFSAGFRKARGVPDAVAAIGHCLVSDPLISLAALLRQGDLVHGDNVLVVATGGHAWAALIVQYVDPAAGDPGEGAR